VQQLDIGVGGGSELVGSKTTKAREEREGLQSISGKVSSVKTLV